MAQGVTRTIVIHWTNDDNLQLCIRMSQVTQSEHTEASKMVAISQTTFWNKFPRMKISEFVITFWSTEMQYLWNAWSVSAPGRSDDNCKIVIAEHTLQNQLMNNKRLRDAHGPLLYSVSWNVWAMQTQAFSHGNWWHLREIVISESIHVCNIPLTGIGKDPEVGTVQSINTQSPYRKSPTSISMCYPSVCETIWEELT